MRSLAPTFLKSARGNVVSTGSPAAQRAAAESRRGGHWSIGAIADLAHCGCHVETVVEMDVKSRLLVG